MAPFNPNQTYYVNTTSSSSGAWTNGTLQVTIPAGSWSQELPRQRAQRVVDNGEALPRTISETLKPLTEVEALRQRVSEVCAEGRRALEAA